ncbi:hypothetical protein KCH_39470 [Kitasatospora cheerisanensis KCTC 2395]|uniref:Uncharacterized protein n=1 Tax=Kitasatospora cheerisanensis KCTC 2395 TaxID=1348663 RepID=A0A066Z1F8_9ACTN|nr:hypothetical protein KCH_39470 [Kitasatospora cheerisanensis KCTC 2395]
MGLAALVGGGDGVGDLADHLVGVVRLQRAVRQQFAEVPGAGQPLADDVHQLALLHGVQHLDEARVAEQGGAAGGGEDRLGAAVAGREQVDADGAAELLVDGAPAGEGLRLGDALLQPVAAADLVAAVPLRGGQDGGQRGGVGVQRLGAGGRGGLGRLDRGSGRRTPRLRDGRSVRAPWADSSASISCADSGAVASAGGFASSAAAGSGAAGRSGVVGVSLAAPFGEPFAELFAGLFGEPFAVLFAAPSAEPFAARPRAASRSEPASRCEVPGAASVAAPSVSDVSTIALVPSATVVLPPLVSSRAQPGRSTSRCRSGRPCCKVNCAHSRPPGTTAESARRLPVRLVPGEEQTDGPESGPRPDSGPP